MTSTTHVDYDTTRNTQQHDEDVNGRLFDEPSPSSASNNEATIQSNSEEMKDSEPPYSAFSKRDKWIIVVLSSLASFFRYMFLQVYMACD
jgi:hypothetical protein